MRREPSRSNRTSRNAPTWTGGRTRRAPVQRGRRPRRRRPVDVTRPEERVDVDSRHARAPRHLQAPRTLREPGRDSHPRERRPRLCLQRGAVPVPPRQRPDPLRPLARRRGDLERAHRRASVERDPRQLGLRNLRARGRYAARQLEHHGLLQARHQARAALLEHAPPDPRVGRLDVGLQDARVARDRGPQVDRRRCHLVNPHPGQRAPVEARRRPLRLLAAPGRPDPDGPLRAHPGLRRGGARGRPPARPLSAPTTAATTGSTTRPSPTTPRASSTTRSRPSFASRTGGSSASCAPTSTRAGTRRTWR